MARELVVRIVGDSKDLERAFARSSKSAKGFQAQVTGIGGTFKRSFAGAASAIGVGFGLSTLVSGIKGAVKASSDLEESISKTNAVFGQSADEVDRWAKTMTNAFGVSRREALETASSFGALFQPLGIIGREAAEQSEKLTELGADLASFYNTSVSDALAAIRSGLVGEAEPLRRYGALLSETRVVEEALAETHKKNAKELTAQEKVLARINLIFKDTTKAQGDYARTSGGLAGQQKELNARIADTAGQIGDVLKPQILAAVTAINDWLAKGENQKRVTDAVKTAVAGLTSVLRTVRGVIQRVNDITGSTRNTLKLLLGVLVAFKTIRIAGTLAGIASNIGLIGTKAEGTTGKVKGLRTALIGKAGLVGAVGLASYELSKMAFESAGWDKAFYDLGGTIYDVAEKLNMVGNESLSTADKLKLVGSPRTAPAEAMPAATAQAYAAPAAKTAKAMTTALKKAVDDELKKPQATPEQRNQWFDAMIGRAIGRVPDVGGLRSQIAQYDQIAQMIRDRYANTQDITRRLNLEDQLWDVIRTRNTAVEQLKDRMKQDAADADEARKAAKERTQHLREVAAAQRESKQFIALGFTDTGLKKIPGAKALSGAAQRLGNALKGTILDTKSNRSMLKRIREVLSGELGAIGRTMRERIQQMIQDLRSQLGDLPKKAAPKRRRRTGIWWDTGPNIPAEGAPRSVYKPVVKFTEAVEKATVALTNLDKLRLFADLRSFGGNLWTRGGAVGMAGRMSSPGVGSRLMPMPTISRGGGGGGDVSGIFGGGGRHLSGAQVTVVQNFNAPTTDRHREARYALMATRTVFDS